MLLSIGRGSRNSVKGVGCRFYRVAPSCSCSPEQKWCQGGRRRSFYHAALHRVAVSRSREGTKGVGSRRRESTAIADALNMNGAKGVDRRRFLALIGFDVCECFVSAGFDMLYSSISRVINMS